MSNEMTAQELIYKSMIHECYKREDNFNFTDYPEDITYEDLFDELLDTVFGDTLYEIRYDYRYGDQEVLDLEPTTSSRHYEIEVRASKIDGVWVAWDFYYGGGKHGEPEAFDWISNARIVDCEERVVTKTEYVFKERT